MAVSRQFRFPHLKAERVEQEGMCNFHEFLRGLICFTKSGSMLFEEPCSKLQGMFCLAAVLRSDCKEFHQFFDSLANPAAPLDGISASLQQATGNALAVQFKLDALRGLVET